jgi:hypothetical protein
LREDELTLDPLFFSSLSGRFGEGERPEDLTDAVNAIKQEYVTVRYVTWLALDRDSTVAAQADAIKARVRFMDSLQYGRWGVRTGIAIQAFVSATNLLDKLAVVAHAYFHTGRAPRKVFFRGFWLEKRKQEERMEPQFEAAFSPFWNPGLAALCDLANDLEDDTPLSRLVAMRHAATHRLLVAHEVEPPESTEWLTRVDYSDIAQRSLEQLRLCRGGIIYLLRAIDAHEDHLADTREGPVIPLATVDVDPDLSELD